MGTLRGKGIAAREREEQGRGGAGHSPHCTAQFLVVHARVALLVAPQLAHSLRVDDPKHTVLLVLPANDRRVCDRVQQQVPDELPQVVALGYCNQNKDGVRTKMASELTKPIIFKF